jgi:MFS transporter, SP family, general alpha glucoside:H+ symporter
MILTASLTDQFGRRPLTVYPYGVTVLSVLCLGIVGCFNYKERSPSALLVSLGHKQWMASWLIRVSASGPLLKPRIHQIFFACLATFSTTGASAIGYAYAAEIPQQRLRAKTDAWSLAVSNLIAIMFSFCTPLMINGQAQWGVKTGFL